MIKDRNGGRYMGNYGIPSNDVAEIVEGIDRVFYKKGYVIPHDKIIHFVMEAIRKK